MGLLKILYKVAGKKRGLKFLKKLSNYSRRINSKIHKTQMDFEWSFPPEPEWFDHYIDLHYCWSSTNIPLWVERGVFGLLAIKKDANVLELCCGDGFNTKHFYSIRVKQILSVDFDQECITHASTHNAAPNVKFSLCDIRYNMPEGNFDNIIFDAALAHFTETEIDRIMKDIKKRLGETGILSGCTIAEDGKKVSLSHHEYVFSSKEDLKRFFEPHFKNVIVFETKYPTRHNLYFFASNDGLPFDSNWKFATRKL